MIKNQYFKKIQCNDLARSINGKSARSFVRRLKIKLLNSLVETLKKEFRSLVSRLKQGTRRAIRATTFRIQVPMILWYLYKRKVVLQTLKRFKFNTHSLKKRRIFSGSKLNGLNIEVWVSVLKLLDTLVLIASFRFLWNYLASESKASYIKFKKRKTELKMRLSIQKELYNLKYKFNLF